MKFMKYTPICNRFEISKNIMTFLKRYFKSDFVTLYGAKKLRESLQLSQNLDIISISTDLEVRHA